jgi:ribosomal protein S18 acetylase RimI-like enzyme
VYKVNRGQGSLTIAKIAVPEDQRHHGYGKRLVKEMIKIAKKDKMIYFVSLSSLPTAVRFYKRMNFKEFKEVKFTGVTIEEGESFIEGQVYMEFKVRNEPKSKKRK